MSPPQPPRTTKSIDKAEAETRYQQLVAMLLPEQQDCLESREAGTSHEPTPYVRDLAALSRMLNATHVGLHRLHVAGSTHALLTQAEMRSLAEAERLLKQFVQIASRRQVAVRETLRQNTLDAAYRREAMVSATKTFPSLRPLDALLLARHLSWLPRSGYASKADPHYLALGQLDTREVNEAALQQAYERLGRSVRHAVVEYFLEEMTRQNCSAAVIARDFRKTFDSAKPRLADALKEEINHLYACQIAAQLKKVGHPERQETESDRGQETGQGH